MIRSRLQSRRAVACWALTALLGVGWLGVTRASAQNQADAQKVQLGDTVITADQLDYDLEKKQYIFTGKELVELISGNSRMTARKMWVQMTPDNELSTARCEGEVRIEKKDPEAGTMMTASAKLLEYFEKEQRATLTGSVVLNQESPKLAKPMVVTGQRVEMDLAGKKNVVHRGPDAQAKAHVQPKGTDGMPAEPVDLVADRIDVNSETQEYVATGKPVMVRPSTRLEARKLRFQVDPKVNDVTVAYAEGDVVFDSKNEKGNTIHATADNGTYNKELNELKLIGKVRAATKEPTAPKPTIYECDNFFYNTATGYQRMSGNVKVVLPEKPKPAAEDGDKSAADGDKAAPAKNETKK
jgi:lipopolysaccharide transport protein LptA